MPLLMSTNRTPFSSGHRWGVAVGTGIWVGTAVGVAVGTGVGVGTGVDVAAGGGV